MSKTFLSEMLSGAAAGSAKGQEAARQYLNSGQERASFAKFQQGKAADKAGPPPGAKTGQVSSSSSGAGSSSQMAQSSSGAGSSSQKASFPSGAGSSSQKASLSSVSHQGQWSTPIDSECDGFDSVGSSVRQGSGLVNPFESVWGGGASRHAEKKKLSHEELCNILDGYEEEHQRTNVGQLFHVTGSVATPRQCLDFVRNNDKNAVDTISERYRAFDEDGFDVEKENFEELLISCISVGSIQICVKLQQAATADQNGMASFQFINIASELIGGVGGDTTMLEGGISNGNLWDLCKGLLHKLI